MGVVYYKQNKNILEPHLSWDEMRLVYVSFNDRQETLTPTAVHCHEKNLELQYICGGRGNLRIGNRLYEVQEGDLLVYNQGELHDESADPEEGLWFYNCGVTGLNLPGRPEGELIAPETSPRIHAGETAGVVESLFKLLYAEVERDLPKNEQITHDILRVLISMILYQLPKERQLPPREKDRLLIACKDYIDGHFMEELTVEKLAERSHMSISGFAHQFKKIFGFPPIQYIIRRRIGEAQRLLFTTDLSITEVSVRVGYDNISYFNNQFKRFAGMSPQIEGRSASVQEAQQAAIASSNLSRLPAGFLLLQKRASHRTCTFFLWAKRAGTRK